MNQQSAYISPHLVLKKYWGYSDFRAGQLEIVEAALKGKDTLALLPTGGGKSICFQVPILCKEGIGIVVSPLIALMQDQVANLKKRGIDAVAITSALTKRETDRLLDNCIYGTVKLLYVSPERLQNELFLTRLRKMKVNLIAVDESHCISQWGYDFRPAYLNIAAIRLIHPNAPVLALTASATPQVVEDIQEKLQFKQPHVIASSFARSNLSYIVREAEDKENRIADICKRMSGCGIVYCGTRARTREISDFLNKHGVKATFYHAGLSSEEREKQANRWFKNECRVICATNAFGMGIDKPDVRFVLHADVPVNPENYFQEAGRAGRDGQRAFAGLFWRTSDVEQLEEQIHRRYPPKDRIKKVYRALMNHLQLAFGSGKDETYSVDVQGICDQNQFTISEWTFCIQLLELAGYLTQEEGFVQSRLHIPVSKTQLYSFQVAQPAHDAFIQTLLRLYGGLFEQFVAIKEYDISKAAKLAVAEVSKRILLLEKQGMLAYEPMNALPRITLLQGRINDDYLNLPREVYEDRKQRELERKEAMVRYLKRQECRSVQLLSYFGEKDILPCGQCDVCKQHNTEPLNETTVEVISNEMNALLAQKNYRIHELVSAMRAHNQESVMEILRWKADREEVQIQGDVVSLI